MGHAHTHNDPILFTAIPSCITNLSSSFDPSVCVCTPPIHVQRIMRMYREGRIERLFGS